MPKYHTSLKLRFVASSRWREKPAFRKTSLSHHWWTSCHSLVSRPTGLYQPAGQVAFRVVCRALHSEIRPFFHVLVRKINYSSRWCWQASPSSDPHRKATRKILNSSATCQWYSSVRVFFLFCSTCSETNLREVLPEQWQTETASVNFHRLRHMCKKRAQQSSSTISYGIQKSLSFIRWVQEDSSERMYLYLTWKRCIFKTRTAYTHTHPPSSTTSSSCWPSKFLVV